MTVDISPDSTGAGEDKGYPRLLDLAENDPLAAIKGWIAMAEPELGIGEGTLLTHERGLGRIIRAVGQWKGTDGAVIADAIATAQALVAEARSALDSQGMPTFGFAIRDDGEPDVPMEPLAGQLTEVADLNRQAADWTRNVGLSWIVNALTALTDETKPAHLAFLPLRLYPGGRFIEQAGAALRGAEDAGLRVTATLRDLIETDLSSSAPLTQTDRVIGPSLWRLYSLIRPGSQVANVAARYLNRLAPLAQVEPTVVEAVASGIAEAVNNARVTTATKAALFRRWRATGTAWNPAVAAFWLRSQLEDAAEAREAAADADADGMFRSVWSIWSEESGGRPQEILQDLRWGGIIREAIERALGRRVDDAALEDVGRESPVEQPAIVRMVAPNRLEDAGFMESAE